jgi:hypothetical protein
VASRWTASTAYAVFISAVAIAGWIPIQHRLAQRRFGPTYTRNLANRLRCNECGARKGYVMIWAQTHA